MRDERDVWDATGCIGRVCKPAPSVPPSNHFGFGRVKHNQKAGTARLTVKVPGPGTLVLRGKAVIKQQRVAKHAGTLKLLVKSKAGARRRLGSVGKALVKLKVTFTPDGGAPRTKMKAVKLIKLQG